MGIDDWGGRAGHAPRSEPPSRASDDGTYETYRTNEARLHTNPGLRLLSFLTPLRSPLAWPRRYDAITEAKL